MRLLLDTHTLLWWLEGNGRLSPAAREAIATADNDITVSAASAYEVSYKFLSGRLPQAASLAQAFRPTIEREGFDILPISSDHAQTAGLLKQINKDPFDRFLVAQALVEGMTLVSNEGIFDQFGVRRLW